MYVNEYAIERHEKKKQQMCEKIFFHSFGRSKCAKAKAAHAICERRNKSNSLENLFFIIFFARK